LAAVPLEHLEDLVAHRQPLLLNTLYSRVAVEAVHMAVVLLMVAVEVRVVLELAHLFL
jgi:hypothetical protein